MRADRSFIGDEIYLFEGNEKHFLSAFMTIFMRVFMGEGGLFGQISGVGGGEETDLCRIIQT